MENDTFLRLEGVGKIFSLGKGLEVVGLRDINLSVSSGDFVVISGPSGSGKTTLLNMIGCLDNVTEGIIFLEKLCLTDLGEKQLALVRRDEIGFVFQAYNLITVLTAQENIEYVMRLQGKPQDECMARTDEIARRLGIHEFLHKLPGQLSGGQQQRVAVARAVAPRPKLILADEPTANLDSKSAENLIDMMLELNRVEGVTVIISSHDPLVIEKAQRSIIMRDGRIIDDR